jgi:exportin-T
MCLQAVLKDTFGQASHTERDAVNSTVMNWAFGSSAICLTAVPFVRNKVSQLLAQLIALQYPEGRWPNCIQEMLAALVQQPQHADMFTRVLLALDQDVISLDIPRNNLESRRSMALKDALRVRDIADVAQAWKHIVVQQRMQSEELTVMCLSVVQKYADWVDIHLLVQEDFVATLFELLHGEHPLL